MQKSPILFKKRMKIIRAAALLSAPLLLFIAPIEKEASLRHESMEAFAHILVFSGVLIRVYASLYSGGQKNKVLLTDGAFSIVRNPLYIGSLLAIVGLGLATGSLIIASIMTLVFLVVHKITVRKEEAFLYELFGEAYLLYCRTVPRWIPNISLWRQPQEVVVRPRMVLLTMRDASGFIFALIFIELVCTLHTSADLRAWINLP